MIADCLIIIVERYIYKKILQRISLPEDSLNEKRRLPTLPHCIAVPSAQADLTSLFGMGRGGTPPLSPPNMGDMLRVTDFYLSF